MKKILSILIAATLLTSCSTRVTDFTILSTKNIELSRIGQFQQGRERVEGEDVKSTILYIPLGSSDVRLATDRALQSIPGAVALVDGSITYHSWSILLYGQRWYKVEGTPLIDMSLVSRKLSDYGGRKPSDEGKSYIGRKASGERRSLIGRKPSDEKEPDMEVKPKD